MIKTIVFDEDGVLCESKDLHYLALNQALSNINEKYIINYNDHISRYDGLPTHKKLTMLTKERGLPEILYEEIWKQKQSITNKLLQENITYNQEFVDLFKELKKKGYQLYVATNSIRQTNETILTNLGIIDILDGYYTNEDVKCGGKPHPEMLLRIMIDSCCSPKEMLVIEDSPNGWNCVKNAGANLLIVKNPKEVIMQNIMNKINEINNGKTKQKLPFNGRILMLAAGAGARFEKAGFSYPKPILDVNGKTMIQVVIDSLCLDAEYIYLFQKAHLDKYNIRQLVNLLTPNNKVIEVDKLTDGACRTALLSKDLINDDKPLFIVNSDQYIEWSPSEFLYLMNNSQVDGGILSFHNNHPKWSYAKVDNDGYVTEVAEKNPISNHATVGIYYFKRGSDFVKYAERMIEKDIRVNGELYLCPVYQQFVDDGKKIKIYDVGKMEGMGDPESLKLFIDNHKND